MKKRWLSIFLIIMMVVGVVPTPAEASVSTENVAQIGDVPYKSIQEAVNAANDGDTVVVTQSHYLDCSDADGDGYAISVNKGQNITIDLNGCTVTADYVNDSTVKDGISIVGVTNESHLIMKDSSAAKTGTIHGITTIDSKVIGHLFVAKANDNTGAIDGEGAVVDPEDSNYTLVFESGNYILDYLDNGSGVLIGGNNNMIILVRGGNFHLGNVGDSSKTHQGNGYPWIFNSSYQDANRIIVTGGTFNADVYHQHYEYEVYVPKTQALKPNSDGKTWTVVDSVACVDEHQRKYPNNSTAASYYKREVGYATLEEAVKAANSTNKNETTYIEKDSKGNVLVPVPAYEHITLLKDCKVNDTLHFAKDTQIDLNNKKILWEGELNEPVISFDNGKTVTQFEPAKSGYNFLGWYTDANYSNPWNWNFTGLQEGQVTSIYAKWKAIPAVAPVLTSQGSGNTSEPGHTVKVVFEEDEAYTYSYQWYSSNGSAANGEPIEGATESSYTIPSDAEVGIYDYYCVVKAKRNDNGLEDSATSDVINVHVYKAPTVEADLTYNGEEQNLIKPGVTAEGKTLEYALQVDGEGAAVPALEWSRDIPKAKDAGDYTVYYRIAGAQSRSSAADSIKVTIEKKVVTITPDDKSVCINFGELPEFTYKVEGLEGTDTLVKAPDITCDADNMTEGTYDIKAANADAGKNYKISYVNGTLTVKVHEDKDKDHLCDFGCGTEYNLCEDKDKDHYCDHGCGKVYGEHKAEAGKNTCAYCGEIVSADNDNPKTGDENVLSDSFAVMLLSMAALAALLHVRRKYE